MTWRWRGGKDDTQLMHIFPLTTYSCIHTRGIRSKTLSKTAAHLSLYVEEEEMSKQVDGQGLVLSADAKPRLKWTRQLHERFTDAVAKLGGADKATPKSVMRLMGIPGLTLFHLKSHLQKYRLAKNQDYNTAHENKKQDCSAVYYSSAPAEGHDKLQLQPQFNEAMFKIQMDVQRKLQEQIEVQRHLQLRIEAQGKYLQTVLRKAQETLAAYSSNSAEAEAAKAELSELVSAVDNTECLSSSFSQDSLAPKHARNADCNSDSCLTSSARPEVADRKRSWRSDDPSEEESDEINPSGGHIYTEMEHDEELDLNR